MLLPSQRLSILVALSSVQKCTIYWYLCDAWHVQHGQINQLQIEINQLQSKSIGKV